MLKTVKDINFKNKRVFVRVDFNVPLDKNNRVDSREDWRIRRTLPTIKYLEQQQAKIIMAAHFGRPGGKKDLKFSLKPVVDYFEKILGQKVIFSDDCCGDKIKKQTQNLKPAEILFLENLRFYPGEEANDHQFTQQLAALADIYVNDAFSNSHREHASIVGLPKILPAAAGLLLAEEIKNLSPILQNPKRPLTVFIGGVKIASKLKFIKKFLEFADDVVLGGALANTVLVALGLCVGRSIIEEGMIEELRILKLTDPKLHLPVDVVVALEPKQGAASRIVAAGSSREQEMIFDLGPDTQKLFANIARQSGTIIWAGPMGLAEVPNFANGTKNLAQAISRSSAFSVIGGGDTVGIVSQMGLLEKISYVSTGGSAMLDFLAAGQLPGLATLGFEGIKTNIT